MRSALVLVVAFGSATLSGATEPAPIPAIALVQAFPDTFDRPVDMAFPDDGSGRAFVVEQAGTIRTLVPRKGVAARPFLDISAKVSRAHNEEGLLALALHPAFEENGQLFVFYTLAQSRIGRLVSGNPRVNVLARFRVKPGGDVVDPASEELLLEIEKPYGNHNGATIAFGPDGYLYLSVGDGGSAGDPHDNGQSLATHLGKVLRIDVDRKEAGRPYAIPDGNPFASRAGALPEIWAYGLRNVWRMSFDRETGELWAGDVGQNKFEEIDVIVKGGNYGWRLREGKHAFKDDGARKEPLEEPVAEYGREIGGSVTGGHVYRGKRFPALEGTYVFADFVSGTFLGLRREGTSVVGPNIILEQPKNISSIAADLDGELYALAFDGHVYRIELDPSRATRDPRQPATYGPP